MRKITTCKNRSSLVFLFTVLSLFLIFSCQNTLMHRVLEPKTITFDSNGGSPVESQLLYKGQAVVRPDDPNKTGFDFDGWYLDSINFKSKWNFSTIPTKDTVLYAKWEPSANYAITLSPEGAKDFGTVQTGYGEQLPHIVTVTNTGSRLTGDLSIALLGESAGSFSLSINTIDSLDIEGCDTFSVTPITGLAEGVYTASVLVSGANSIRESFDVIFTVSDVLPPEIIDIIVKTPPAKSAYVHNDFLNLSGLEVSLVYDNGDYVDVSLDKFSEYSITTNISNGTNLVYSIHNGVYITVIYGSLLPANAVLLVLEKAEGEAVGIPTLNSFTDSSITVNTLVLVDSEQTVVYAISTIGDGTGVLNWQDSTTFNGLLEDTTYYIYARSKESENYDDGPLSVSAPILLGTSGTGSITLSVQDFIDYTPILAAVDISKTGTIHPYEYTISIVLDDYDPIPVVWTISGSGISGTGDTFTVDARNVFYNQTGTHQLTVLVYKDGIPYMGTVLVHIWP